MTVPNKRKKIGIVSTAGVACGIAYCGERLAVGLQEYCDVDMLKIDADLGRDRRIFSQIGMENHIKEIAEKVKDYDYIVIEGELGIFSYMSKSAAKFMEMIINSKKSGIAITMHSYGYTLSMHYSLSRLFYNLVTFRLRAAFGIVFHIWQSYNVRKFWYRLAELQKKKKLDIIQFNKNDSKRFQILFDSTEMQIHPLCYFTHEEIAEIRNSNNRDFILDESGFSKDDKLIVFSGFLSYYKGVNTLVQALARLPDEFKLVIAGASNTTASALNLYSDGDAYVKKLSLLISELKLENRVYFAGEATNTQIEKYFSGADVVVLPYFETEQCTSGPGTLAAELSDRVVASNIRCFRYIEQDFGADFEFFEVGNHRHLKDAILRAIEKPIAHHKAKFDNRTRAELYLQLLAQQDH